MEKKALQRDEDNCAVKMCDGGIEDIWMGLSYIRITSHIDYS